MAGYQCVNDDYDPDPRNVYATVADFLTMCRACFGETPTLFDRGTAGRRLYEYHEGSYRLVLIELPALEAGEEARS